MVSKASGQERKFSEVTSSVAERVKRLHDALATAAVAHELIYGEPLTVGDIVAGRVVTVDPPSPLGSLRDPHPDVPPSEYAHCLLMWLGSSSAVEWDEAA